MSNAFLVIGPTVTGVHRAGKLFSLDLLWTTISCEPSDPLLAESHRSLP